MISFHLCNMIHCDNSLTEKLNGKEEDEEGDFCILPQSLSSSVLRSFTALYAFIQKNMCLWGLRCRCKETGYTVFCQEEMFHICGAALTNEAF